VCVPVEAGGELTCSQWQNANVVRHKQQDKKKKKKKKGGGKLVKKWLHGAWAVVLQSLSSDSVSLLKSQPGSTLP